MKDEELGDRENFGLVINRKIRQTAGDEIVKLLNC